MERRSRRRGNVYATRPSTPQLIPAMSMGRPAAVFCGETIFRGAEGHLLTAMERLADLANKAITI